MLAVSNSGRLTSVSPQTGQVMKSISAGDGFFIPPVIAGNTIYLLDEDATLIAFR